MINSTPEPTTIENLVNGAYLSFAMQAGMELDLFSPLNSGPMKADQIAEAIGVSMYKLEPLLYALVAAGLLKSDVDYFSNTREADQFLVQGKPTFMGGMRRAISTRWNAVQKTAETIRTGVPQARTDFANMSEEQMELYIRGRESETLAASRELLEMYDFSSDRRLLDVGGGGGFLALAFASANPQIQATVVDLSTVTPITHRIVSENGAADRVQVVTADIVNEPVNGSYDVAVLRNFIQVLSADQARRALINIGNVIGPGGTMYILGQIMDDTGFAPIEVVGMNLFFLNTFDEGQAYSEQLHRSWLAEAGFECIERVIVQEGRSIVRARKKVQV